MTFRDRFTDVVLALRGEHSLVTLGSIAPEAKQIPYPTNQWGSAQYWPGFSGTAIDYKSEVGSLMNSSLVMAVINFTATTLPQSPFQVMRTEGDTSSPDPKHKLAALMKRPNTYCSGATLLAGFSISWWIDGNAYFYAVPSGRKEIVELWYIPHFMLEPRWPGDGKSPAIQKGHRLTPDGWVIEDQDPFISSYEFTVKSERYQIPPEHIIHFRRFQDPDNVRKGLGAFSSVLREIDVDNATANFSAALMKNYGVVDYLVTPKEGVMDEDDAKANKERFIKNTTGDNRGGPLFNTMAMEVQKLAFNPQELDLSKLRYVPESRVAAVTGIPAAVLQFMVGLENGTSYASYEQAKLQAYESVIFPIQDVFLSEVDAQLLTLFDGPNPSTFSAFDYSKVRVLQEDRNRQVIRAVTAYKGELITRARGKVWIGEPVEPGDDVYYGQRSTPAEPPVETPPKQLPRAQTKSVQWEGLTLAREPTELERRLDLKAINDAFDTGKADIAKVLAKARTQLIKLAIAGLESLEAAEYHTLAVTPPVKFKKALRAVLAEVIARGRALVADELKRQGKAAAVDVEDDEEEDELDSLADKTLSRLSNDVQSRAIDSALRSALIGLGIAEIVKRVREDLEEGSTNYIDRSASEVGNVALGMGRAAEAADREDEWREVYFSSVLDQNTCSPCAEEDGNTYENLDDAPTVPFDECEGGPSCRCVLIMVAA